MKKKTKNAATDREAFAVEILVGHLAQKALEACAHMPARKLVLGKLIYLLRKELEKL